MGGMCPSSHSGASGYWYSGTPDQGPARAVLEALRNYRSAELEMRRRIREEMNINEKDMVALRHLMQAHQHGDALGPTDLSRLLAISTASTTALIDRLVGSGHIQRQLHPTDRRALRLVPTAKSHVEMHSTLGRLHERMMKISASLTPEEAAAVARYLGQLADIMGDEPEPTQQTDPLAGPS